MVKLGFLIKILLLLSIFSCTPANQNIDTKIEPESYLLGLPKKEREEAECFRQCRRFLSMCYEKYEKSEIRHPAELTECLIRCMPHE